MSLDYISGTWQGFFTYGPDYPLQYLGKKEEFIMELKVVDEIISGTCIDPYIKKFYSSPATVEGTLVDGTISLIKRYPYLLSMDEQERLYVDKSLPSHEVHYIGQIKRKLFSNKYFIEGEWDISGSFLDEEGNSRYYTDEGHWEMHRIG